MTDVLRGSGQLDNQGRPVRAKHYVWKKKSELLQVQWADILLLHKSQAAVPCEPCGPHPGEENHSAQHLDLSTQIYLSAILKYVATNIGALVGDKVCHEAHNN